MHYQELDSRYSTYHHHGRSLGRHMGHGPVMCLSPFESEPSQSHLKFCRVESESSHKNGRVTSSHWFTSSSQCRVIQFSNCSYIFLAIGPPVDFQWL